MLKYLTTGDQVKCSLADNIKYLKKEHSCSPESSHVGILLEEISRIFPTKSLEKIESTENDVLVLFNK